MIRLDDLPPTTRGALSCAEPTGWDADPLAPIPRGPYVWLTWLPDVLRDAGCRIELVEGYASRGRPASTGGHNPSGLIVHHTGSTASYANPHPSLRTVINGRPDLPGPLAHLLTAYNGIIYIPALGRCNHAGNARAAGGMPSGDGNALYVGNEVECNGTQKLSPEQDEAVALSSAAIIGHMGVGWDHLNRHADTSLTGKWDLGGYSTAGLRAAAAAVDIGGDVALTDADKEWIKATVTAAVRGVIPDQSEDVWTRYKVREPDGTLTPFVQAFPEVVRNTRAILAEVREPDVPGLPGSGATPEQVEGVVRKVFKDAGEA